MFSRMFDQAVSEIRQAIRTVSKNYGLGHSRVAFGFDDLRAILQGFLDEGHNLIFGLQLISFRIIAIARLFALSRVSEEVHRSRSVKELRDERP